jgi:RNA polymerase sigma-70 factor (ECF subfamily)
VEGGRFALDGALRGAIARLRAGTDDGSAARLLDERLRPRLVRYFHVPPMAREDAEDLAQRTLTLAFQKAKDLESEERFVGWLFAIARHTKEDERERRRAEGRVLVVEGTPDEPADLRGVDPAQGIEDARRAATLRAAVAALPPRQRQCLVLRVRDELGYEEISRLVGVHVFTVRNHIAEAKKSLRRKMSAFARGRPD